MTFAFERLTKQNYSEICSYRKNSKGTRRSGFYWCGSLDGCQLNRVVWKFFGIVRAVPTKTWIFIELCLNCFFAVRMECEKNLKENSSYCFLEGFLRVFLEISSFSSRRICSFDIRSKLDITCKLIEFRISEAEMLNLKYYCIWILNLQHRSKFSIFF